jgi:2-methylisocitrate lyase-like PEP mutase family enzyme
VTSEGHDRTRSEETADSSSDPGRVLLGMTANFKCARKKKEPAGRRRYKRTAGDTRGRLATGTDRQSRVVVSKSNAMKEDMLTQVEKGLAFRALHERDAAFIIPNPWDLGSARILASLGFEALATTSMGFAFSVGRRDGGISRERMMEHVGVIAAATELPVSADLENGFGDSPEMAAETIRMAAAAGVVGGSIEDASSEAARAAGDAPIYEIGFAAERIRAAAEAARGLPFTFTLTGRAENYLHGRPELKDTIARLQAYQEAGADVLYAPGLATKDEIAAVVRSVDRPVNALMGLSGVQLSLSALSEIGVRRVSVGSSLCRAALGAFLRAGREMRERGTFDFAREAASSREISAIFKD